MKYKETCSCGAIMDLETERPTELARAKSQWSIDHGPHGDNTITIERKRALLEYNDLQARVKIAEDRAYPAMVVGWNLVIANKRKGEVLYKATITPGDGFHWEDPKSPISVNLQPATMKLPNLETKEREAIEAEQKNGYEAGRGAVNPSVPSSAAASSLMTTLDTMGEKPPPAGSVLNPVGLFDEYKKEYLDKKPSVPPFTAKQIRESIVGKTEVSDEQGQQDESKRDDGAKASKRIATRSRIRRSDVGRRGDK